MGSDRLDLQQDLGLKGLQLLASHEYQEAEHSRGRKHRHQNGQVERYASPGQPVDQRQADDREEPRQGDGQKDGLCEAQALGQDERGREGDQEPQAWILIGLI